MVWRWRRLLPDNPVLCYPFDVEKRILALTNTSFPQILAAERDFLLVYKPPRLHSAPLARPPEPEETLLDVCAAEFPEIMDIPGRKPGEGGLLHRLDYETQGLILIARTRRGMEDLLAQQKEESIVKGYSALAAGDVNLQSPPPEIASAFRPCGAGRKRVRPVTDGKIRKGSRGDLYRTEIAGYEEKEDGLLRLSVRIYRGFRHQIRSHLSWIGFPILNDGLYGGASRGKGFLGLRAFSLAFRDPSSGKEISLAIPPLELREI